VLVLSFKMYTPLLWYLIPAIIIVGLILSSRLQLDLHNPGQVWSGFMTGFLGFSIIVMLL
jgi:membrane-associated phospholipid phosphatase